jgi:hypothetical protein
LFLFSCIGSTRTPATIDEAISSWYSSIKGIDSTGHKIKLPGTNVGYTIGTYDGYNYGQTTLPTNHYKEYTRYTDSNGTVHVVDTSYTTVRYQFDYETPWTSSGTAMASMKKEFYLLDYDTDNFGWQPLD